MLAGLMHSLIRGRYMWPTTSRFQGLFALSVSLVVCQSPYLIAQAEVIRIEEHWELAITEADSQTNAPQVMLHFSPFGGDSDTHFEVDLNHALLPQYSPGGYQVRAMQGDSLVGEARLLPNSRLNSASETISWIQIAQKQPAGWAFAVGFGTSQSWGSFGGPETVVTLPGVTLPVKYSPEDSVSSSGVIFAKNRVERLTLKKVRFYTSDNQVRDLTVGASVQ